MTVSIFEAWMLFAQISATQLTQFQHLMNLSYTKDLQQKAAERQG